jgi:hypothetical protein
MFASSYGKMKEKNGMSDTKISQPPFASAIRIINLLPRALAARVIVSRETAILAGREAFQPFPNWLPAGLRPIKDGLDALTLPEAGRLFILIGLGLLTFVRHKVVYHIRSTSGSLKLYPNINRARIQALKELTKQFSFSFASGDVIQLENGWFVTHTGLVRLARRKRCRGIHVEAVDSLCDSAANRFVLKATVYPSKDSAGFCRLRRR